MWHAWRYSGEWIVGTRVRAVSGNPYTPYEAHVGLLDSGGYAGIPSPDVLSRRTAPFFQADLRVDKRWVHESWMMSVYVDVQNATNHANSEFRFPSYDFTSTVAPASAALPPRVLDHLIVPAASSLTTSRS